MRTSQAEDYTCRSVMPKQGDDERPSKRRKIDNELFHVNGKPITSAEQISEWTKFNQTSNSSTRSGLDNFERYLTFISQLEDLTQRTSQYQLLKEYCQWQKAASDEQLDFYDLFSTWSFAVENDVDDVLSVVPAVFAQLLATISGSIELRNFGLSLISNLLRRDQSRLFHKCFASPRSKPHLVLPCLRLLTEIITFDAGTKATELWYRRDLVMPKIEAMLEQRDQSTDRDNQSNSSVRQATITLTIALLRFLDAINRTEFLLQGRALHACLQGLSHNSEELTIELIRSIDKYIVDDLEIPRSAVIRFFNATHLESVTMLYQIDHEPDVNNAQNNVRNAAHNLLQKLCTSTKGILLSQNGWYPPGNIQVSNSVEDDYIDLGVDSPFHFDEYHDKIPVANTALATFTSKLKPHRDPLQSALLLDIFKAAPELVAEYFSRRNNLPIANSDDTLWRSQFGLLFSLIELDVPHNLGCSDSEPESPPPLSIVIESILPRSFDRSYLTKMMASEDNILVISGARLISNALKKLGNVLTTFAKLSLSNGHLWEGAARQLSDMVEMRLPRIREVTLALQRTAKIEAQLRQILLECILTYYQILPTLSESVPFDIGPFMTEICSELKEHNEDFDALHQQLTYCIQIAETSSSTKWLHKSDNDSLSPLMQLLRVIIQSVSSPTKSLLLRSAQQVFRGQGMICSVTAFIAVCSSFVESKKFSASEELYKFFDSCLTYTNQRPVKYLDEVEKAAQLVSDSKPVSLFVSAVAEQWNFAVKRYVGQKRVIRNLASWVARLFALLDAAGENYRVIMFFQDQMLQHSPEGAMKYLQDALQKTRKKPLTIDAQLQSDFCTAEEAFNADQAPISSSDMEAEDLTEESHGTITIPDSFQGLEKWQADFDIELEFGTQRLQRLILCISSQDAEIRLQAQQTLRQITHHVDTVSTHESKQQVFLILGELCETIARYDIKGKSCPAFIPELANSLLSIVLHPGHIMFGKANKFLLHKPSWSAKGTLTYWMEKILFVEPDEDVDNRDVWNCEREWLLRLLLSSLRTQDELDLYRRCNIWEELLSLYASPCLSSSNKRLIFSLIWRGLRLNDGVHLLWTRFGLHSWLETVKYNRGTKENWICQVQEMMKQNCDEQVIDNWKIACAITKRQGERRAEPSA